MGLLADIVLCRVTATRLPTMHPMIVEVECEPWRSYTCVATRMHVKSSNVVCQVAGFCSGALALHALAEATCTVLERRTGFSNVAACLLSSPRSCAWHRNIICPALAQLPPCMHYTHSHVFARICAIRGSVLCVKLCLVRALAPRVESRLQQPQSCAAACAHQGNTFEHACSAGSPAAVWLQQSRFDRSLRVPWREQSRSGAASTRRRPWCWTRASSKKLRPCVCS